MVMMVRMQGQPAEGAAVDGCQPVGVQQQAVQARQPPEDALRQRPQPVAVQEEVA